MRKLGLIVAAGLVVALLTAIIFGMSVAQMVGGFALGAVWMIGASVLVNSTNLGTCNCDEYGEELAWMGGEMDGFELHETEAPLCAGRRDRVRSSALMGGLHSQSSTDPEARDHVR